MEEKEKNLQFIIQKIEQLAGNGVELIVFPELALTGFIEAPTMEFRRKYWEIGAEEVPGPSVAQIAEVVQRNNCFTVLGMAQRSCIPMEIYNSSVIITPKKEFYITQKVHLPQLERFYFMSGSAPEVVCLPFGKVGIVICYDLFFPEIPRCLAVQGAEIVVVISSFWEGGKEGGIGDIASKKRLFENSLVTRAIENQAYMILCNASGEHNMGSGIGKWKRFGKSKVVSGFGEVIAQTNSNQEDIVEVTLTEDEFLKARAAYTFLMDRRSEKYTILTKQ